MSLTLRILLALVLGLGAGATLSALGYPGLAEILAIAGPVGALWLDSLTMTIVPLVFSLIVTGIASARGAAAAGGLAARALLLFAVALIAAGIFSAIATPALLALFPIPMGAAESLSGGLGGSTSAPVAIPAAAEWIKQIVPTNPVRAAADGAMLQLVVFALIFGFALAGIEPGLRTRLSEVFDALVETMLKIVRWVLLAAPIGVFALALVVGARAGLSAAGGLAHYVALISAVCIGLTVFVYVVVAVSRGASIGAFARAAAPAQAVAFSTQSSLASLPAMVEGARRHMDVPPAASNLVLPLAVSLFRITSPAANLAVAIYLARLHGIEIGIGTIAAGVLTAAVVSLASVGLPSQVSFFSVVAPVCLVLGAPIELLGLLLAVESIPDIFRTVGNVTADVAVTRIGGTAHAHPASPPS